MQTQTTENAQVSEAPTFEKVWAMMQENAVKQEKRQAEFDRQMKKLRKSQKEYDRQMKEADRKMKDDFNARLGSLTNLFGDLTLGMVAPKLREKFVDLGLVFTRSGRELEFSDKQNKI